MAYLRVKDTHIRITSTLELVPGTCEISDVSIGADGGFELDWCGETEMNWDGQETETDPETDERLFLGADDETYRESQLEMVEEEESDDDA